MKCIAVLFFGAMLLLFINNKIKSKSNSMYNCVNKYGENGLCKLLDKCRRTSDISPRDLNPTLCGRVISNKNPVVCCVDINNFTKPLEFTGRFAEIRTIHERKCREYTEENWRLTQISNEINLSNFICSGGKCSEYHPIVGGTNAEIDEFPHFASVGWKRMDGKGYDWNCGGSLISKQFVITAAHCLSVKSSDNITKPSKIRLGGSSPFYVDIINISLHHAYKSPQIYNDIGLIQISKSIEFSLKVFPACLSRASKVIGNATVIGWGKISHQSIKHCDELPKMLQKVTLEIFDDATCNDNYNKIDRVLPKGVDISQFCAGSKFGGKDACQGDSGSPIQIKNKKINMFEIIGVTSFGQGCGSKRGGVYTKISSYLNWIEHVVWPNQTITLT